MSSFCVDGIGGRGCNTFYSIMCGCRPACLSAAIMGENLLTKIHTYTHRFFSSPSPSASSFSSSPLAVFQELILAASPVPIITIEAFIRGGVTHYFILKKKPIFLSLSLCVASVALIIISSKVPFFFIVTYFSSTIWFILLGK